MTWTVKDAQALRKRDGERRRRMREKFGQRIEPALSGAMKFAAPLLGNANYRLALTAVARRMNRYRETAFDGYTPSAADIVCSAYFKAGTNWVMHVCYQITQLGEGQFDHIQDEIAWPDAAEPRYWRALADSNASSSPTGSRVIKSHLPAELVPLDSPAKFVAVTRDPLDCAASGFILFEPVAGDRRRLHPMSGWISLRQTRHSSVLAPIHRHLVGCAGQGQCAFPAV